MSNKQLYRINVLGFALCYIVKFVASVNLILLDILGEQNTAGIWNASIKFNRKMLALRNKYGISPL